MNWKIRKFFSDLLFFCRSHEVIDRDIRELNCEIQKEKQKAIDVAQAEIAKIKAKIAEKTPPVTICRKCDYWATKTHIAGGNGFEFKCTSPDAPITDFQTGLKDPYQINPIGNCKYYKKYTADKRSWPFWRHEK